MLENSWCVSSHTAALFFHLIVSERASSYPSIFTSPAHAHTHQADDEDEDMAAAITAGRTFNIAGYESWQYEDDSGMRVGFACVSQYLCRSASHSTHTVPRVNFPESTLICAHPPKIDLDPNLSDGLSLSRGLISVFDCLCICPFLTASTM